MVYKRMYCWVIYAQCNVPGVEEDEVTVFLAVFDPENDHQWN